MHYVKERARIFSLFFLWIFFCTLIFFLHELPLDVIGYALLLLLFFGSILLFLDYRHDQKRQDILFSLRGRIALSMEELPLPATTLEESYQGLLQELYRQYQGTCSEVDRTKTDLLDFYSLWVHQIKTPISALRLLLQTEHTKDDLFFELTKMEGYVEFALQYLRIDQNASDWLIAWYDLADIVRKALRKHSSVFIHQKISLAFSDFHCRVLTDAKWLGFVMEQILSNALKYTKKGVVRIYLEERVLVIEDTGIGICEEDIPRIFDKGYTGLNGRQETKSTGLGLYLCKQVLDRLSHNIKIESILGRGTLVRIEFPQEETLSSETYSIVRNNEEM